MKKIRLFIISILCILCLNINVNAYSNSTITANKTGEKYEYISGLPIYYNTANGYNLYVLNANTYFTTYTTLNDPVVASDSISYIVNNSNSTSSSYKNYYIAQVSILWYQDYINGNDTNIPSNIKNTIKNNTGDTVCYYINKIVNNAINYNISTSIKFLDNNISFTRNGNYYYSNVINVETYNLNSTPSVKLYNAPNSSDIINNTLVKNGTGSFQIRVPVSSMNNLSEKDFEVYITGYDNNNKVYQYTNYGSNPVIYGRNYSGSTNKVEASMPVFIKTSDKTNVRINILDKNDNYIRNLNYYIYSGDCTNKVCSSDNLITSFTTSNNYISLNSVLSEGIYTLVNKSSNNNYNLPTKYKFNVKNISSVQKITVSENNKYDDDREDSLRKVIIYNDFNDSNNYIKIYTSSNYLEESYNSKDISHEVYLSEGTYYIVDTKNNMNKLYFRITSDGRLQVKYNNDYVYADYISLDIYDYNDSLSNEDKVIYDEDSNTYYIDGVESLEIDNKINTKTTVSIEWLNDIVDCPITSLSKTVKYVIGASIMALGTYFLIRNVKRTKNNN